jgi:eukaryotic-like serine/threonine-protein kinase
MSLKQFLKSKIFIKQLLLSVAITLGLFFLIFISLGIYTRHGQAFPVPNVFGMTEDEFASVLRKAHLQYKIIDSTYNPEIKPGGVEDQIPDAGHKVKKNRMIYLTINTIAPEKVAIPRLTDISYRQAIVQLESAGLISGKIMYEPSEFQNLVLRARVAGKDVSEGEIVLKGTVVDLVLGSGERGSTSILPDLRGLTLSEAETILSNSLLTLGTVFFDETVESHEDSLKARVYRQHPSPDFAFQANSGSEVDVWLSTDASKSTKDGEKNKEDSDFF